MKKLALFAALLAMVFATSSCNKTDVTGGTTNTPNLWETEGTGVAVDQDEINDGIEAFVTTHFPEASILSCNQTEHYYKVILSDNTKIYFTQAYEWVEVNCEHSTLYTAVPVSIVPEQITAYVTANHPNQTIEEIEREANGWEIELSNEQDLKFDSNFNIVGNGGGDGGGTSTDYPNIETFVSTYFPDVDIRKVKAEDDEYEVELTDGTEITFNLSFDWTQIDCENSMIYTSVPSGLVPEQITAYVSANFPNQTIKQIEKENYGWEIELNNDHDLAFDSSFNVISGGGNGGGGNVSNTDIETFVSTYFPQVTILKIESDEEGYDVDLSDGTEISFTLSFEWEKINCEDGTVYGMVPTELVPEQITAYVTANYPNSHIDQIEKMANGWEIELSNGVEIQFDSNFNVTHIDTK